VVLAQGFLSIITCFSQSREDEGVGWQHDESMSTEWVCGGQKL